MYHRPSGVGGEGGARQPGGSCSCEYGSKFAIEPEVGSTRSGRLIITTIIIIERKQMVSGSSKTQQYISLFLFFLDNMFRPIAHHQVIFTKLRIRCM